MQNIGSRATNWSRTLLRLKTVTKTGISWFNMGLSSMRNMMNAKQLVVDYNNVKRKRTDINLTQRENVVLRLVENKDNDILWQYLFWEIKPLLENFDCKDKEIVRQYFRYIGKQKNCLPDGHFRIQLR